MEEIFSYEEIWEAVLACDGNRASWPDEFNFTFFIEFWMMIRGAVMKMFQEFFVHGKLVKGLNAGFISFKPKKTNLAEVSDFRPISLIGSVYKLISKVLAGRLQRVILM